MTGHLDADRLAMFRAGLLGRWRARRAAAHLASCESCASLDAQLAVLTSVLAAVGPAVTTPPDVAARLDAALAAAQAEAPAPHRARHPAHHPDGHPAHHPDGHPARHPDGHPARHPDGHPARHPDGHPARHPDGHPAHHPASGKRRALALPQVSRRLVAPVAAATVLIAAAGFGLSQLGGGSVSSGAAGSAAGSAAGAAGAGQQAGPNPVTPVNGLLEPGMSAPRQQDNAHRAPPSPSSAPFSIADAVQMVRSEIDFKPGTLRTQVTSQLRAIKSLLSRQVPAPQAVASCVLALIRNTSPALVELAHYAGRQAVLVAVQRGTIYQVWIAPYACTSSGNVLARLDVPVPAAGTTTP